MAINNDVKISISAIDNASAIFEKLGGNLGKFSAAARVPIIAVGAAIIGAGKAAFDFANSAAAYGDEIQKMAQRTGIAAETFTALKLAAEQSGASAAELENAFKFLEKNISNATDSSSAAAKEFARLGISVKDAQGHTKDTVEIFKEVSDKIGHLGSASDRTRESMALMGRGGQSMVPLMMEGSASIEAMMNQAKLLGITITDSQARMGDRFKDSSHIITESMQGMVRQIGFAVLPAFIYMQEGMIKALAVAAPYFTSFAKGVGAVFEGLMIFFQRFGIVVYNLFADVGGFISIILTGIMGVVVSFVNKMIDAVNMIPGIKIQKLSGDFADSMKSIALETERIADRHKKASAEFMNAGKAYEEFKKSLDSGKGITALDELPDKIGKTTNAIKDMKPILGEMDVALQDFGKKVDTHVSKSLNNAFKTGTLDMATLWNDVVMSMEQAFSDMVGKMAEKWVQQNINFNDISKTMGAQFMSFFSSLGTGFLGLLSSIGAALGSMVGYLASIVGALLAPIAAFVTQAFWALTAFFAWTGPFAPVLAGATIAAGFAAVGALVSQIKLAEGGIVTGPTNALIGEGGQPELVMPLSKAKDMGFIGGNSGGQGGGSTFNITLNMAFPDTLDSMSRSRLEDWIRKDMIPALETVHSEGRLKTIGLA